MHVYVRVVGLKGNVSEAEHPLLCEGTRRQKGELAVAMLVQYKDDTAKLSRVSVVMNTNKFCFSATISGK